MSIKIAFLVQMPPPIHGAAVMNEMVYGLLGGEENQELKLIRLNYAQNFQQMHASLWRKTLYFFQVFFRYLVCLIFNRPRYVYIAFSPYGFGFFRDFVLGKMARAFGSTLVLHLHGTGLESTRSSIKEVFLRSFFKKAVLLVLSESLKPDVLRFSSRGVVRVVPNAVPTPCETHPLNFKLRKCGAEDTAQSFVLLYMANLDVRKGVIRAIEIFAIAKRKYRNAELHIVGADTARMSAGDLKKIIEENYSDISGAIVLHGPKYGAEKEAILKNSDIFIYPTEHDAAPLVVLEAQSHGLPVICSNQGALSDMVDHGNSGYVVKKYCPEKYMAYIGNILREMEFFSAAAAQVHADRYSLGALKRNLEEIFNG